MHTVDVRLGIQENVSTVLLFYLLIQMKARHKKTSTSQQWGQPSAAQLLQYDKGGKMKKFFPPSPLSKKARLLTPLKLSSQNLRNLSHTPAYIMTKFKERNKTEIIAAQTLFDIRRKIVEQQAFLQCSKIPTEIFTLQYCWQQYSQENLITTELWKFYAKYVVCTPDTAL